jgi:hypothetical protein
MKRNLVAGLLAAALLASTALAQKLPPFPGPQPGREDQIAQPSFDCGNPAPQPIGDNMTMQRVFSPFMYEDPANRNLGKFNLCVHPYPSPPEIACMLIALPSGQRVMVGGLSRVTVIEGAPLEPAQRKRVQSIGFRTLLACNDVIKKSMRR